MFGWRQEFDVGGRVRELEENDEAKGNCYATFDEEYEWLEYVSSCSKALRGDN